MENKQPLPHATLILVFGILSILTCCCYGVFGLVFGIVALFLANKSRKLYYENPEGYTEYNNVNVGRILAIIGIVLCFLYIIYLVFLFATIGLSGLEEMQNEWLIDQSI